MVNDTLTTGHPQVPKRGSDFVGDIIVFAQRVLSRFDSLIAQTLVINVISVRVVPPSEFIGAGSVPHLFLGSLASMDLGPLLLGILPDAMICRGVVVFVDPGVSWCPIPTRKCKSKRRIPQSRGGC